MVRHNRGVLAKALDFALLVAICVAGIALIRSGKANDPASAVGQGFGESVQRDPADHARSLLGVNLPELEIFGEGDVRRTTDFGASAKPTVVMAFRSDCRYCEMTAPIWRELADDLSSHGRFVVVSIEDLLTARRWTMRHDIPVADHWVPVDLQSYAVRWRVIGVPATFVVDTQGVVRFAFFGVVKSEQAAEIRTMLSQD